MEKQENITDGKVNNGNNVDSMISLYSATFERVKLQQEVRDRWFEHYLTIIGAITAIATLCFGYYTGKIEENSLMFLLAAIFLLAGAIGVLFYVLYLMQRRNYRRQYRELEVIQEKIYVLLFSTTERNAMKVKYNRIKRGADFITLLIENLICSMCFGLCCCFASIALEFRTLTVILVSSLIPFIISAILIILYRFMEAKL